MEYKSMNVSNEQEERVIYACGKFGWKLKNTQTVCNLFEDYTKLIFEREETLPNLHLVKVIEKDFWDISATLPAERPRELPWQTINDFTKTQHPSLYTDSLKRKLIVKRTMLYTSIISLAATVFGAAAFPLEELGIPMPLLIPGLFVVGFLGFLLLGYVIAAMRTNIYESVHWERDAFNPKSKYYPSIKKQYESYLVLQKEQQKRVEAYDSAVEKMAELFQQAENLLQGKEL